MTPTIILAAAVAVSAPATPAPHFEPLKADATGVRCTAEKLWCAGIAKGSDAPITVTKAGKPMGAIPRDDDGAILNVMPTLLRLSDGSALISVAVAHSVMYSGGGGAIVAQRVIRVGSGSPPRQLLSLPLRTDLMIRACFSEKDAVQRAGACHDEYALSGQLKATGEVANGLPVLSYAMNASSYPRGVSRNADSLAGPPLKKADLVWQTDPTCTVQRTFRFDIATNQYTPDRPLPDCSEYTEK